MKNFTFSTYCILLLLGLLVSRLPVRAQNMVMPASGSASYTTCAGTLYDSGGPTGSYGPSSNSYVTLLPGTAGSKIKLSFTSFDIGPFGSVLQVFDGVGTSTTFLGSYTTDNHPTDLYATSASGALTVQLYAYGNSKPGFAATVSCVSTIPPPDFAIPRLALDRDGVLPGQYARLDALLGNLSGRASDCDYACYLSTDAALSPDDVQLPVNQNTLRLVAAGVNVPLGPAVTIPSNVAEGSYYVVLVADPNNQVAESNETNNVQAVPLLVSGPAPDLAFSSHGTSTRPGLGGTVTFIGGVTNQGTTTAPATRLGFYLSADAVLSASDVLLGSNALRSLAVGSSQQFTATLALPASAVPGPCYLLAVADDQGLLTEIDRLNNTIATAAEIVLPTIDLSILYTPIVTPNQAGVGATFNTICYLQNTGSVDANPSTIGYYLSTDQTLSANDQLMGSTTYGLIGGYDYWRVDGQAVVPAGVAPGRYYLLAVADHLNQLAETDENNNVWAVPFEVVVPNIDLAVFGPHLANTPTPITPGMRLVASAYLGNKGTTAAANSTLGCYLSADTLLSANDLRLGRDSVQVLSGGNGQLLSCQVRLPTTLAPGTYYLLLVADYRRQQPDTDRSNNVRPLKLTVAASNIDLSFTTTPSQTLMPTSLLPGATVTVLGAVANTGTTSAIPAALEYYLSTDQTLSANDVPLGQDEIYLVQPGIGYGVFNTTLAIPAGTAGGSYYVLVAVNYHGQLPEANLTNNLYALPLTVRPLLPDLTLEQLRLTPASTRGGRQLAARLYARNLGNALAPLATIGYYLSADAVFDSGDALLLTTGSDALEAGERELRQATLTLPPATAAGSYYLLAVADPTRALPDSNPANNVASAALAVAGPFEWPVVPISGSASLTSCATRVYAGNGLAPYPNNAHGSLTLLPGTAGGRVRLTFNRFQLETGADYLQVFDGPSTSAPLLGLFSGQQVPASVVASNQNASGALTLYFFSDNSVTDQGFEAIVSCEQALPTRAGQAGGYDLRALPNPVAGGQILRVQLDGAPPAGLATLTLLNVLGQAVASRPLPLTGQQSVTAEMPTVGLAAGVYLLRLQSPSLELTRRVVVE